MATFPETPLNGSLASPGAATVRRSLIDRWIYVFMAGLCAATILVGFIPDSIYLVAAVRARQRPPFPIILHVHAVLMGAWVLLLMAQTFLVASGRPALHRQLGLAGAVLAPAIVLAGMVLVPTVYRQTWDVYRHAPAAQAGAMQQIVAIQGDLVLAEIRDLLVFGALVTLGLLARRTRPEVHKRLMILATLLILPPAIGRIPWLPSTMPGSPLSLELFTLLLVSPLFAWDLFRLRRVHRAYLIAGACYAPVAIAYGLAWGTSWWLGVVPRLMGAT